MPTRGGSGFLRLLGWGLGLGLGRGLFFGLDFGLGYLGLGLSLRLDRFGRLGSGRLSSIAFRAFRSIGRLGACRLI